VCDRRVWQPHAHPFATGRARSAGTGTIGLTPPVPARIRWSRVLIAQARVAAGFYNRPDVRACLAGAVLSEIRRH